MVEMHDVCEILIFLVDMASVSCFYHHDQQMVVLDVQDYPVFTHPVSVERMPFCSFDLLNMRIGLIFDTID
jgi:hypothetical protein